MRFVTVHMQINELKRTFNTAIAGLEFYCKYSVIKQ